MIIAIIMITSFPYVDSYAAGDIVLRYFAIERNISHFTENDFNFSYDHYLYINGITADTDVTAGDNYLIAQVMKGDGSWTGANFSDNMSDAFLNILASSVTHSHVADDGYVDFYGIEVPDVKVNNQIMYENIYYIICTSNGGYSPSLYIHALYIPDGTKCFLEQGRIMCDHNNVYISTYEYKYTEKEVYDDQDNLIQLFYQFNQKTLINNSTNQIYTTYDFNQDNIVDLYQMYPNFNSWLYSDIPVYYAYQSNYTLSYSDYLNQSPYFYGDYNGRGGTSNSVGKYVLSGEDDTGFIIDRRPTAQINGPNSPDDPTDPIDHSLGVLEGSFNNLIVGNSVNYQYLFTNFVLNNYTKNMKNNINLKLNYRVTFEGYANGEYFNVDNNFYDTNGFYDSYNIYNSNYIQIDLDEVLKNIRGETDNSGLLSVINTLPAFNGVNFQPPTLSMYDTLNLYINNDLINESIVHQEINTTIWQDIVNSADSVAQKIFGQTPTFIDKNANVQILNCTLYITQFLEDKSTNKTSESNIFIYDYLSGNVQEVGGFENNSETDIPFNGFYMDKNWSLNDNGIISTSGNNGGIVGGSSSSNASVGDIYVNVGTQGVGQVIVDMPADEWLQHSPNFNELITTVKNGLTDVSEGSGSVVALLTTSYSVFPVEIWGYLSLAVAIISALAIIRYIRRG